MNIVALLILYNPYYQSDVIESHLEILKTHGKVAFGKVKSKMRNTQLEVMQSENHINTNVIDYSMFDDNKDNAIKRERTNKHSTKEKPQGYTTNKNSALALALSNTLKINTKIIHKQLRIQKPYLLVIIEFKKNSEILGFRVESA